MNKLSDAEHYALRLEAERRAMESATSEQARAAHRELADIYAERLAACVNDGLGPSLDVVATPAVSPIE